MKTKAASETYTLKSELVLPNDTNALGNLMGGKLLHWMDIVSAISAQKHSNRVVVTAAVDFVEFRSPIRLGELVCLESKVTRSFNTSMEVRIDVSAENLLTGDKRKCNVAYYTFVAVDQSGNSIPVNQLKPETEEELKLYEAAQNRRELRLVLAGRIKPGEAENLMELFKSDKLS